MGGFVSDRRLKPLLSTVVGVARQHGISLTAAGIAFYMFNSIVPLLVVTMIGLSVVGWLETVVDLLGLLTAVDADRMRSTLDGMIGDGAGRVRAAAIAVAIFAWSSLTMVQSINVAFGKVYDIREERSWVTAMANSVLALVSILVVVPLFLVAVAALLALTDTTVVRVASLPLLFLALLVAFVPMYVRFSGEGTTIREVLPGAAVAALAWTLGAFGFRLYAGLSGSVQLYGVAGGVMLVLSWLYVSGLALLLGAIFNAVLGGRVEVDEEWEPRE